MNEPANPLVVSPTPKIYLAFSDADGSAIDHTSFSKKKYQTKKQRSEINTLTGRKFCFKASGCWPW